jgi:signal transduction histidine kinase
MKGLFDLSFRYKIPLWSSVLIIATALVVSGSLMRHAYNDLKQDLFISADSLGRTLAKTLFPAILHDDIWRAFETVNAPFYRTTPENPVQAKNILVLNDRQQILVSTQPKTMRMLADIRTFDTEHAQLAERIAAMQGTDTQAFELPGSDHIFVAVPIADEEARLGTLVITYSKKVLFNRFVDTAWGAAAIGLLVLAVLLPVNWYWGQRMAVPLVQLAGRMGEFRDRLPPDIEPGLYAYRDELGRLFEAFNVMLQQLKEKALLEKQMLQSERLAAVGRLAASIAHEINNPLGGMLTAINTLKSHGEPDARTLKTVSLIERGLMQIKDTVAALLVEARLRSRSLSPHDIEDVRTLLTPAAQKKRLEVEWNNALRSDVVLPATFVRQILLNLLMNAIQAAAHRVSCVIGCNGESLRLAVVNDGKTISAEQMEHLFEPFSRHSDSGSGLGLWVTYQIVHQHGGRITAESVDGQTRFVVTLPLPAGEQA